MNLKKKLLVWGTGVSAEKFCQSLDDVNQIEAFIDPKKTGYMLGKKILSPEKACLVAHEILVVCSSFFSHIIPKIQKLGFSENGIFIFNNSNEKLIPLSEMIIISTEDKVKVANDLYYHLPWLGLKSEWEPQVKSNWLLRRPEWKENCPIPDGEDFYTFDWGTL